MTKWKKAYSFRHSNELRRNDFVEGIIQKEEETLIGVASITTYWTFFKCRAYKSASFRFRSSLQSKQCSQIASIHSHLNVLLPYLTESAATIFRWNAKISCVRSPSQNRKKNLQTRIYIISKTKITEENTIVLYFKLSWGSHFSWDKAKFSAMNFSSSSTLDDKCHPQSYFSTLHRQNDRDIFLRLWIFRIYTKALTLCRL